MYFVYQGQQTTEAIVLQNDVAGVLTPINISTLSKIVMYLKNGSNIVAKYKYPTTSGYNTFNIDDPTNGHFTFQINAADSANFVPGLPLNTELKYILPDGEVIIERTGVDGVPDFAMVSKALTVNE